MSVIAESVASDEYLGGRGRHGADRPDVPDFCRAFVEQLVDRAQAIARRDSPGKAIPDIDWHSIWSAGDDAPSRERAVGCIVTAAYLAARDIAGSSAELLEFVNRAPGAIVAAPPPGSLPVFDPPRVELAETRSEWPPPSQLTQARVQPEPPSAGAPGSHGLVTGFTWVRNIGIVLLLFVAWQLWGTSITQHHAQHQLQKEFEASVRTHHVHKTTSTPALISATVPVPQPPEGSVVAELQVPAIGIDQYVVMGTAEADLAKGPGHYVGTAMPGQAGNVAIAGHRTTNGAPFNQLGQLVKGDNIFLTTTSGERLAYVVTQLPYPVSPNDTAVLDNFGDNRITLTTCNPEFSAAQRLIVVGELKGSAPEPAVKAKPAPYHLVDPATASWDWSILPLVMLEGGVLLALGLANRRFTRWWGRDGRWFILVPMWTVVLYLFFQSVTTLLPATY